MNRAKSRLEMNLCFFHKFLVKFKKMPPRESILQLFRYGHALLQKTKKMCLDVAHFFLLSEEVLAYNGIIAISIRVEAFLVLFF